MSEPEPFILKPPHPGGMWEVEVAEAVGVSHSNRQTSIEVLSVHGQALMITIPDHVVPRLVKLLLRWLPAGPAA